jgi:hypothetical protein
LCYLILVDANRRLEGKLLPFLYPFFTNDHLLGGIFWVRVWDGFTDQRLWPIALAWFGMNH